MNGAAAEKDEGLPRPVETREGDMLYRTFGKTAEKASDDLAIRIVRSAVDGGINFMDNWWDYNKNGGAVEAFVEGRKAGKIRYIGFTGHKDPAVHPRMPSLAQEKQFRCDAVLFPSNVMDWSFRRFAHEAMPVTPIVIRGVEKMEYPEATLGLVKTFRPLEVAHFDATAKNPAWLG